MIEGGEEEWQLVPGGRRRGGPLHDKISQGRGGQELANPRNSGRREQQYGETGPRGWGREGGVTDLAVGERRIEMAHGVTRYRFD